MYITLFTFSGTTYNIIHCSCKYVKLYTLYMNSKCKYIIVPNQDAYLIA